MTFTLNTLLPLLVGVALGLALGLLLRLGGKRKK